MWSVFHENEMMNSIVLDICAVSNAVCCVTLTLTLTLNPIHTVPDSQHV